jgi:nucleotide-binding universal stress UspA family protein
MKSSTLHIVCATDFSPNSRSAAEVAAAIASRLKARLTLVHVADETRAYQEGTSEFRSFLRRNRTRLRKEALHLRRAGVEVMDVLLQGESVDAAILEFVEQNPAFLIVVSSVSKTAFDRWTLGSVSEGISQGSPVPTLVVREPDRLLAWARQDRRLKVMVAADFSISSDAAVSWVQELRKIGPCTVTAAHIYWPPEESGALPPGANLSVIKNSPSVRRRLSRNLQRRMGELIDGEFDVRVESNWGRSDAALVQLATELDADLIIVGTHQRHGVSRLTHSSISRGVLRHAAMSVASVPVLVAVTHGGGRHRRIQRVMVATDLSPMGNQAIPWAYAVVAPGGVVKLVHVHSPWELPGPLVPHYNRKRATRGDHRRQVAEARDKLGALVPPAAAANGIASEVEVIEDRDPARAIGVAAQRFDADVICLGSHGRTNLAEALGGSVSRAVVAHNSQPVLLVQPSRL